MEKPAPLETGQLVQTPSGSVAQLISQGKGEGTVQWASGDRASFRLGHLHGVPGEPFNLPKR